MRRAMGMMLTTAVTVVAIGATTLAATPATGASGSNYEDPFFLNWPSYVPASPTTYAASTGDDCRNGQIQCVDKVIREMTKRYNGLRCDHDSTFAFTYLLTTEEYRSAVNDPLFFSDNAFINHQDAVFGDYYFDQYDDWHAGRVAEVSPAWRIAFKTAQDQKVSGLGNVLLGLNAHVNRDLPFVLAEIGLTKPDGTSRKPDHDRVNDFLAATNQYLLTEAAKFLDATVDDGDVPGISLDNNTVVQSLVAQRETAWRNAERLVSAPDAAARAQVAQEIEEFAATSALTLRSAFSYTPLHGLLGMGKQARNSFCNSHFQTR